MDPNSIANPDYMILSFLSAVMLLINLATAVHILLNKHDEAVSAVMWLLMVFLIPPAGLILYIFFGINRIKTRALKIQIANQLISEEAEKKKGGTKASTEEGIHTTVANYLNQQHTFEHTSDNEDYQDYNKMLDRLLPDTIPLKGNKIDLLLDGTQAYPQMLKKINHAKHSIHLQSYIIMNDEVGKIIFKALRKKASQGVKVKILYDRYGSWPAFITSFITQFFKNMENFEAYSFTQFRPWSIQLRNHRKLMVIDGEYAFIGGINISKDNYGKTASKDRYIHDLHCAVQGPVVGELQFSFLRDWHWITKTPPIDLLQDDFFPPVKSPSGHSIARVVASGPGQDYEATDKVYMTAVTTAKSYVWLMSPYFVPDKAFCKLLCATVARGIEIKVIVPEKNNLWYIRLASQSLYRTLLEAGVRIYEKKGPFSHAKSMLIDGQWAKMGSSNCDVRSFKLNYELDFIVEKGDFLDELHSQFEKEIENSQEIHLKDILNKNIFRQLAENACALFTPIL